MIIGITDRQLYSEEAIYLNQIDGFLRSDIDYLIVRDKELSPKAYQILIEEIISRNPSYSSKIIIHNHLDIGKKLGISHVHLPESRVNEVIDNELIVSYSIHPKNYGINNSMNKDAISALDELTSRAFFILVSPVFETTCKPDTLPLDIDLLHQLRVRYKWKLVLLGGLDGDKIQDLKNEGFKDFALRSGLEDYIRESVKSLQVDKS